MKKLLLFYVIFLGALILPNYSKAQNVAINESGSAPNSKAILDVSADVNRNKGVLLPRVTTSQRNNISPASSDTGLTVFDTDTKSYWWWDGSAWVEVGVDNRYWKLTGNSGTSAGTNFIGTTDDQDLVFKTNNTEHMRLTSGGYLGIGTTSISYPVTVVDGSASRVGSFVSTETSSDNIGVYGECASSDYYGYGGVFKGGWTGALGIVYPSGSNSYIGLYGYVSGGSGANYGGFAHSTGGDNNFGFYAICDNGSGADYGIYGKVSGTGDHGIYGYNSTTSTTSDYTTSAVYGESTYDVDGVSNGTVYNAAIMGWDNPPDDHDGIGVYGHCWPDNYYGYGGWFDGGWYGIRVNGYYGGCDGCKSEGIDDIYTGGVLAQGSVGVNSIGSKIGLASISKNLGLFSYSINGISAYFKGDVVKNGADITVFDDDETDNKVVTYSSLSSSSTIQVVGTGNIQNGTGHVNFDNTFSKVVSDSDPIVVIITPTTPGLKNIVVLNTDKNGFDVSVGNNASGTFNWLAIGKVKAFRNKTLPEEITNKDFEQNQINKLYPSSKGFKDITDEDFFKTKSTKTSLKKMPKPPKDPKFSIKDTNGILEKK